MDRFANTCEKCFEFMLIDYSGEIPRLFCEKCDKEKQYKSE